MADEELTISTSRKRRAVVIDETVYQMIDADEVSFADVVRIDRLNDLLKAWGKDSSEDAAEALMTGLKKVIAIILPELPADIALSDLQRIEIFKAFTKAPVTPTPAPAPEAVC